MYWITWLQHFGAHVVVFDASKSWRAQDVLVARFLRSVMSGIHFGIRCNDRSARLFPTVCNMPIGPPAAKFLN